MRPCRGFVTTSICSIQWPTDSPTAWHITFPRVKCAETKSCQSLYSGGVTCHSWSCVVHWGHVWVPWWTHQRGDALSCVHVHVSWRQTEGQKDLESGLLSRLNPHLWNRPPPQSPVLMCWPWWLCCPCWWLCWLAFGCMAPCGWAGCCVAPVGVGCWTWACVWGALWGGVTPVAVKNWLIEEHRSAIWAASSDQLLSSAWRMLSFRPDSDRQRRQWQTWLWLTVQTELLHEN